MRKPLNIPIAPPGVDLPDLTEYKCYRCQEDVLSINSEIGKICYICHCVVMEISYKPEDFLSEKRKR